MKRTVDQNICASITTNLNMRNFYTNMVAKYSAQILNAVQNLIITEKHANNTRNSKRWKNVDIAWVSLLNLLHLWSLLSGRSVDLQIVSIWWIILVKKFWHAVTFAADSEANNNVCPVCTLTALRKIQISPEVKQAMTIALFAIPKVSMRPLVSW